MRGGSLSVERGISCLVYSFVYLYGCVRFANCFYSDDESC